MYEAPRVTRFGSLQKLTLSGFSGGGDGCIILDPADGSVVDGNPADGTFGAEFGLPLCEDRFS
jgi:hypothetical protein